MNRPISQARLAGELLAFRKASGLTQRQLSVKTGIQQSEISRIEAAHANPTLGTITVLARALGAGVRLLAGKKRKAGMKAVASRSMKHWFDVGHRRGMLSLVLGDPLMPHFLFALSTPVCGIRAPLHTRRGAATLDSRNGL